MNRSTPGLPVHHQLLESTQTHVHWVGDAIQPSHPVVPFSSCSQSFPASGSFPISQLFTSGGQSIGVSALASSLPKNTQDWSPLEWTMMLGRIGGRSRRGRQDEMAGWHHRLDGHEFGWTPGDGDGQGGLACCSSWGCKESDTTEVT